MFTISPSLIKAAKRPTAKAYWQYRILWKKRGIYQYIHAFESHVKAWHCTIVFVSAEQVR